MMMTLAEQMARIGRHFGDRTAVRDGSGARTWAEVSERVAVAAGMLAALDLSPGARIGIHNRNSARFDELKYAAFHAGLVGVPVNWRLAPGEIAHILEDSEVEAIFVEADFLPAYEAPELAAWQAKLVCLEGDVPADIRHYDTLFNDAAGIDIMAGSADDDALILYTGGTTGRSKGVRLTHGNILSCATAFALAYRGRADDTYLHLAPMFHSADLLGTGWFLLGAAHAYLPVFSPEGFLNAIRDYGVTVTIGVPTMLMMTVTDPAMAAADTRSLRILGFGASPMDPAWIRRTADAFPHTKLANSYGLTETAPDLTVFNPDEFAEALANDDPALASVGKPNALIQLKVVDGKSAELPPDGVGEILARGPNITPGYLNLPEETAAALRDGWLHTGDIGRIDARGYVYLVDRKKDLIITGGENVYSSEVETALYQLAGIHECAVIGTPDERLGEMVTAVIVPAEGAGLDAESVIAHCRSLIGGYKIPRRVEFIDAMPKSAMGKILKNSLRDSFAG